MNLDIALAMCQRFEGFRGTPYLCPAGVATIGYGSTFYADGLKVTLQDSPISEPAARALLVHELEHKYAPAVIRLCPALFQLALQHNDWGKLCAIVDFAYNLGAGRLQTSTLRRKINQQDWLGAKAELSKWVRGGGKVLPGLVARRAEEGRFF